MRMSFGSDPEFMIYDESNNLKSAIDVLGCPKDRKYDLGNHNSMFYDNVNLELNVRAYYTLPEVLSNFINCFTQIAKNISPHRFRPQASGIYKNVELMHKDAKIFGCEPEFCAYEMSVVTPPTCTDGFRSAGGHIHLGSAEGTYPLMAKYTEQDRSERDWGKVRVVRMLDLFVGIPSLHIDHDPTTAARRRLYGKAGTHRPKESYGVEYRSMGNFWLASPSLVTLVYELCSWVVDFVAEGGYKKLWPTDMECVGYNVGTVRNAIDNTDKKLSAEIMNTVVKKFLPGNLFKKIFSFAEPHNFDFYKEWGIRF